MARPKGSPDLAPMIRGAFKRAALRLEEKGKPLSLLIEHELEHNTLECLKAMRGFIPAEMMLVGPDEEPVTPVFKIEFVQPEPVEKPVDNVLEVDFVRPEDPDMLPATVQTRKT